MKEIRRIVFTNNNPAACDLAETIIDRELLFVRYRRAVNALGDSLLVVSGHEEDVLEFVKLFYEALEIWA